jgi:hypothetical protein
MSNFGAVLLMQCSHQSGIWRGLTIGIDLVHRAGGGVSGKAQQWLVRDFTPDSSM